jgi:hypothetical protein
VHVIASGLPVTLETSKPALRDESNVDTQSVFWGCAGAVSYAVFEHLGNPGRLVMREPGRCGQCRNGRELFVELLNHSGVILRSLSKTFSVMLPDEGTRISRPLRKKVVKKTIGSLDKYRDVIRLQHDIYLINC